MFIAKSMLRIFILSLTSIYYQSHYDHEIRLIFYITQDLQEVG